MNWQDKYDKAIYGVYAFLILFLGGMTLAYFTFISPSSLKAFFTIMLKGSKINQDDLQTQIFTLTMLPALFFFYFLQFRWQMHRASQAFVGMILFSATFMMAAKFL